MSEKLCLKRGESGDVDLSESALRAVVRTLKDGPGIKARLPEEIVDAAQHELIRLTNLEERQLASTDFARAATKTVRAHPNLLFVARCEKVRDESQADAT